MRKFLLKKSITLILLGLGLFLYPCPLFSSEADGQSKSKLSWIIKNIKEKEKNLKTFTAKFVQIKKTSLLQELLHSEGMIYFDYTGKLLLKVTSPSPSMVLLKNNMLFIYHPDILKTEKKHIGNNILKNYFGIGQSIKQLQKQYSIQLIPKTSIDSYHLILVPKTKAIAKYIESIEVEVRPKNWLPERLYFLEREGDWTTIYLEFISINKPLPQGIFSNNLL